MGFPGVKINVTDGNLQQLVDTQDVAAIVAADTALAPTTVFTIDDARDKLKNNPVLLLIAEDYYTEINGKSKLWVFSPGSDKTVKQIAEATDNTGLRYLMRSAGYEITLIGLATKDAGVEVGKVVSQETKDAIGSATKNFGAAMLSNNTPVRMLVGATVAMDGGAIEADFKPREAENPYVGVVFGSTANGGCGSIGTALGRACKYGEHIKIGSGKNGALSPDKIYFGGQLIDERMDIEELHDRGVITFHHRPGSAGYYFGVDYMCTAGDYKILAHGRVIDKAVRIVAATATPYIEDIQYLNEEGNIDELSAANMETVFSNAVKKSMSGQISGVKVIIDTDQDLISTSTFAIRLRILPLGYSTWIEVTIGLTTSLSN